MIKSKSFPSDEESSSSISGRSGYSFRTRSTISDLLDTSWKSSTYKSRSRSPGLIARNLFYDKWVNAQNDFPTMNRNGFTSSFRIRYYKFTRRRIKFILGVFVIYLFVLIRRYMSDAATMHNDETSDTFMDENFVTEEAVHFKPEPQDSSSSSASIQIYNSSPVVKLSNGMFFPLVGTSLANIDPRNIPVVVSTQLNEVKTSSSSGGSIALISIDGSSINANDGAVVTRAIKYFNKRRNIQVQQSQETNPYVHRGLSLRGNPDVDGDLDNQNSFEQHSNSNIMEIHLVSKISHDHLGYGRTNLALQESLTVLPQQNKLSNIPPTEQIEVKVHVILHSPKCDGQATWGDCEGEDAVVDDHIKQAGPSPNSTSWKESWAALEEAYFEGKVKSIGVSNYNLQELEQLFKICKVKPHFYQGSIWSVLFDKKLMKMLKQHGVVFHAFNINKGTIERRDISPVAYQFLVDTAVQLELESGDANAEDKPEHEARSVTRLILAWLVQREIVVTPKASSLDNLSINSPSSIANYPKISNVFDFEIETAVKALVTGEDVHESYFRHQIPTGDDDNNFQKVSAEKPNNMDGLIYHFINPYDEDVALYRGYCTSGDCNNELNIDYDMIAISNSISPREKVRLAVYPGDEFMIFDMTGYELEKVTVSN